MQQLLSHILAANLTNARLAVICFLLILCSEFVECSFPLWWEQSATGSRPLWRFRRQPLWFRSSLCWARNDILKNTTSYIEFHATNIELEIGTCVKKDNEKAFFSRILYIYVYLEFEACNRASQPKCDIKIDNAICLLTSAISWSLSSFITKAKKRKESADQCDEVIDLLLSVGGSIFVFRRFRVLRACLFITRSQQNKAYKMGTL
jgi:hypothetical protein